MQEIKISWPRFVICIKILILRANSNVKCVQIWFCRYLTVFFIWTEGFNQIIYTPKALKVETLYLVCTLGRRVLKICRFHIFCLQCSRILHGNFTMAYYYFPKCLCPCTRWIQRKNRICYFIIFRKKNRSLNR